MVWWTKKIWLPKVENTIAFLSFFLVSKVYNRLSYSPQCTLTAQHSPWSTGVLFVPLLAEEEAHPIPDIPDRLPRDL